MSQTSLNDKGWLQAIIDRIDEVGWARGYTFNAVSGNQCIIGAAAAVNGFNYKLSYASPNQQEKDIAEQEAAARLAHILEGGNWLPGIAAWIAISDHNDRMASWGDLKEELVRIMEAMND